MSEAYTIDRLLQEMDFGTSLLLMILTGVVITFFVTMIKVIASEHRTWKQLRQLEKEVRQLEKEKLQKENELLRERKEQEALKSE